MGRTVSNEVRLRTLRTQPAAARRLIRRKAKSATDAAAENDRVKKQAGENFGPQKKLVGESKGNCADGDVCVNGGTGGEDERRKYF